MAEISRSFIAESRAQFFVLYSDNVDIRIEDNDLEETVFHESVHATLDNQYAKHSDWLRAQQQDVEFVTRYAKDNPAKEDLAETALFAFSLINNSARMPADVRFWLEKNIPNRLEFLYELLNGER